MNRLAFQWDEENVAHVVRHSAEPFEAEEVLDSKPLVLRTGGDKYLAYGQTETGRYLLVVFARRSQHVIRVIAARDLTAAEKRNLKHRK